MEILSIGNSFSQDAHRYLHSIARADGCELNCFNLYIGGCPISRHYRNMLSGKEEYMLQVNGHHTGFPVSLEEALLNRDWDIITVQQVSTQSPDYSTYQPYLEKLVEYVRLCAPKAKIAVHQTWAYEQGCPRLTEKMGYSDYTQMLCDVVKSYQTAAEHIGADYLIPSGEVFGAMVENGIDKIHRDHHHASLGLGRYALGLIWYKTLTGNDVLENPFCDLDEEVTSEQIAIAKKCVQEVSERYVRESSCCGCLR